MLVHTTCPSCGGQLEVTSIHPAVHPHCPPSPRPADQLQRAYLAAVSAGHRAQAAALEQQILDADRRPPDLQRAALTYAAWGWPVFPCVPGRKEPATPHGFRDATSDPDVIHDWWHRWPGAGIGLPTGHRFDVVDIDPAGLDWWIEHRDRFPAEIHGYANTPRGGLHLYLPASGGGNLTGRTLVPGVDYRGVGGYVLAPPTTLAPHAYSPQPPRGRLRYLWLIHPSPLLTGLVAA